jgi:hypothetical protein
MNCRRSPVVDPEPDRSAMPPWDRYQDRYNERPETFDAYVDVWNRVPEAQTSFGGWVAFAQAASAEPSWAKQRLERVLDAERIMYAGGYEIGPPTPRGARRWVTTERPTRFGTFRLFGLKISV